MTPVFLCQQKKANEFYCYFDLRRADGNRDHIISLRGINEEILDCERYPAHTAYFEMSDRLEKFEESCKTAGVL